MDKNVSVEKVHVQQKTRFNVFLDYLLRPVSPMSFIKCFGGVLILFVQLCRVISKIRP